MSIDFQSPDAINASIDALVGRMYYGEDHEVYWGARELIDAVPPEHTAAFRETFLERLRAAPDLGNIFLAGCFGYADAVPTAIERLGQLEDASGEARTILYVLAKLTSQPGVAPEHVDAAFNAIRPYLDSAAEQEALQFLTQVDFERALPHLRAALRVDHHLQNVLHILHARRRATDLDTLLGDITTLVSEDTITVRRRLVLALRIQDEPYNPFPEHERDTILGHLV